MKKVFEIDIETAQAEKASEELYKDLESLKQVNKDLVKASKDSSEAFNNNAKAIVNNKAQIKELSSQYQNAEKALIGLNQQAIKTSEYTKQVNTEMKKEVNTINDANQQITRLNKIKKNLNVHNEKEKKLIDAINKKIDKNTAFVKDNSSAIEKQKMNIGNYQGAVSTLNPTLGAMFGQLMQIKNALVLQKTAMQGSAAATNLSSKALKFFKIALIATGIGAIVVILGSLIAYLSKSQAAMDKMSEIMAGVGAVVGVLVDRFADVGKILTKVFSQSIFTTIKELTGTFEGMGDEMEREIRLAIELERATNALRDTEIGQIVVQAQRKKLIEENRMLAKDELKTYGERIVFLKAAQALEVANMNENVANAQKAAEIEQGIYDMAKSDAKDLKLLNEKKAASIEAVTNSLKLQRTLEAELQSLGKRERAQQATWAKKRQSERDKELENAAADKLQKEEDIQTEIERVKDFENEKKQLENEIAIAKADEGKTRDLLKLEQDYANHLLELESIELQALEKEELEVLLLEQNELAKAAITEKYKLAKEKADTESKKKSSDAEKRLAAEIISAKMEQFNTEQEIANNLMSIGSSVFGQSKLMQSAMTAANTYFTAQKAYQSQFMPVPDPSSPLRGGIAAAAAIASGLARVAKINAIKFAEGGVLEGKTHNQGGIHIEAETGEAIINRKSTSIFRPLLSEINQAGGGVAFADGGLVGGMDMPTDALLNNTVDITSQMSNIRVINVASETAEMYDDVMQVENRATI